MSAAPWTEAHEREALRRTYELAAELAGRGMADEAFELCEVPRNMARSAGSWRSSLGCGFDPARVRREVRRVRGLAEGRLVRETERMVLWPDGCKRPIIEGVPVPKGWPILRVTRIRRATR